MMGRAPLVAMMSLVLPFPQPAEAGGNWIDWDRDGYLPGQVAVGEMADYRKTATVAEHAPYLVWLSPVPREWPELPPLPDGARVVGRVTILGAGRLSGGAHVSTRGVVSFTVPASPGSYLVSICDDPCRHPLAVDPTDLRVFASAAEAEFLPRVERLREKVDHLRQRLATKDRSVEALQQRTESTERWLRGEIEVLTGRLAAVARRSDEPPILPGWALSVGVALFASGVAAGRRSRRRRPVTMGGPLEPPPVEMLVEDVEAPALSRRP